MSRSYTSPGRTCAHTAPPVLRHLWLALLALSLFALPAFAQCTDLTRPVALCQNFTAHIGAGGTYTITPADVDGGSFDDCGIVTRVVPAADLRAETDKLAAQLAASAPHALRGIIDAVVLGGDAPIDIGLDYESQGFAVCVSTEDMREGTKAFLEKRKPTFVGR